MDTYGFNVTNNGTDCPKITKHDEQFLHSIQFWIGGVVSCCVAITGKNRFCVFFVKKVFGIRVLNYMLGIKIVSIEALIIPFKNIWSPMGFCML